jgi:hypothetical protein
VIKTAAPIVRVSARLLGLPRCTAPNTTEVAVASPNACWYFGCWIAAIGTFHFNAGNAFTMSLFMVA